MIHIVDYGLGNIAAFLNMYKRLGVDARPVKTADDLDQAERIILPGVGSFDHAMDLLDASGMRATLDRRVLDDKVPVMGVCVGMQILTSGSDEGRRQGLGWIPGMTRAFVLQNDRPKLPLPHMGWNDVAPRPGAGLFDSLGDDPRFYFLHSFFVDPVNPAHVAARADYGFEFACAVNRENIWGVQFHPEKSHHFGAALLKRFATI